MTADYSNIAANFHASENMPCGLDFEPILSPDLLYKGFKTLEMGGIVQLYYRDILIGCFGVLVSHDVIRQKAQEYLHPRNFLKAKKG